MPRPGPPQPPTLKTEQFGVEMNGIIEVNTSNSYELSWKIPEDNGVPIDYFLLAYYPVRRDSVTSNSWARVGDITKKEIPHRGNVRDRLDLQFQDTYYRIELQAHNQLGFSPKSSITIKTNKDDARGSSVISPPSMLNSVPQLHSTLAQHLLIIVPLCFGVSTLT